MDTETARRRLLAERERLLTTLAAARSIGEGEATSGIELTSTVEVDRDRVDAALARLEKGTYGSCEVCARVIEEERLEVTPSARTCIEHRERETGLRGAA